MQVKTKASEIADAFRLSHQTVTRASQSVRRYLMGVAGALPWYADMTEKDMGCKILSLIRTDIVRRQAAARAAGEAVKASERLTNATKPQDPSNVEKEAAAMHGAEAAGCLRGSSTICPEAESLKSDENRNSNLSCGEEKASTSAESLAGSGEDGHMQAAKSALRLPASDHAARADSKQRLKRDWQAAPPASEPCKRLKMLVEGVLETI